MHRDTQAYPAFLIFLAIPLWFATAVIFRIHPLADPSDVALWGAISGLVLAFASFVLTGFNPASWIIGVVWMVAAAIGFTVSILPGGENILGVLGTMLKGILFLCAEGFGLAAFLGMLAVFLLKKQ